MDKAPDAFRTISEVADHLETPAHVLRFWESRFPQVKPVKGAGGRRYYRPSDVALLSGIRRLLHSDGMTIRGVQKILREQGVRHVASLGGEVLPEGESLEEILPPPEPMGQILPLTRPAPQPAEAVSETAPLDVAEEAPEDLTEALASEVLADMPPDTAGAVGDPGPDALTEEAADVPHEVAEAAMQAPDDWDAAEREQAAPAEAKEAQPQTSDPAPLPASGFGGFGLDLDVPRAGEGGFIAFSSPVRSAPAPRAVTPPPVQPSLFDLPVVDAPLTEAFTADEDSAPEAPYVFVETDEAPSAEVTALAPADQDTDLAVAALMAREGEDAPEAEDEWAAYALLDAEAGTEDGFDGALEAAEPPAELAASLSEEALQDEDDPEAALTLPASEDEPPAEYPPEDVADSHPEWDQAPFDDSQAAPAPAEDIAPAPAADLPAPLHHRRLAARLRALGPLATDSLFPLADLQARLGLLQAQMVEAASRSRRGEK